MSPDTQNPPAPGNSAEAAPVGQGTRLMPRRKRMTKEEKKVAKAIDKMSSAQLAELMSYPKPLTRQDSERAYSTAAEQIKTLRDAMIVRRNTVAARQLIKLASVAVRAVHALWNDPPATVFPWSARHIELPERREMLRTLSLIKHPFPCLHFWDEPKPSRKKKLSRKKTKWSGDRDRQTVAIDAILAGPFKAHGLHNDYFGRLLRDEVYKAFRKIQESRRTMTGLNREIQLLPQVGLETRLAWTPVVRDWIWQEKQTEIFNPRCRLYQLCRPDIRLKRGKGRKMKRLTDKIRNLTRSGRLLEPKEELRYETKQWVIAEQKVSPGNVKDGLYTAIWERLGSSC